MTIYDEAWQVLTGRNDDWGGCAKKESVERIARIIRERDEARAALARVEALEAKWRKVVETMSDHNRRQNLHHYLEGRANDLRAAIRGDQS